MSRTALLALALALPVSLPAGNGKKPPGADPLPVGSFWVGNGENVEANGPGPDWGGMVLHINGRKGKFFEATAWYPGIQNGVSRMSGVLDGEGGISIHEPSVVYGEWNKTRGGVIAGGQYDGRADSKAISVTGAYKDPNSGAEIQCSFTLLRAPMPENKPAPSKPK